MPLGLLDTREYEEVTFQAEPGDTIVLYSDGITDHINASGTEFGRAEDTMEIYRGKRTVSEALESVSVWRYTGKDSLKPPKLTAVEQFRKALGESEKAEASKTKNP